MVGEVKGVELMGVLVAGTAFSVQRWRKRPLPQAHSDVHGFSG